MKSGIIHKFIKYIRNAEPEEAKNILSSILNEKGFLESVFDSLKEGVLILDENGKITYANHSSTQLLGFKKKELKNHYIQSIIRGSWETFLHSNRTANRDIELPHLKNSILNIYISPLEKEKKKAGTMILIRNLQKNQENESQTSRQEKLNSLSLLSAGLAHEIGNPLNSLNIHMQLMRREIDSLQENETSKILKNNLVIAEKEIQRLDEILQRFLHSTRPKFLQRKTISLRDTFFEVSSLLKAELEKQNIKLSFKIPKDDPLFIEADKGYIEQILINILKNSYQAIKKQGIIEIELQNLKYRIGILIKDNGKGINPEMMNRLFEPYCSNKKKGTGLGLFIVRRLVHEHGGEITIESQENKGCLVRIYLPKGIEKPRLVTKENKE